MDLVVDIEGGRNVERLDRLFEVGARSVEQTDVETAVREILDGVQDRGDQAVIEYTEEFDHVTLEPGQIEVSPEEMQAAVEDVDNETVAALGRAADNIIEFHEKNVPEGWIEELRPGGRLGQRVTPIDRVGVYVPGGRAFYPSSVLMTVIPARVAGCSEILMVSPPSFNGAIHPCVLTAARIAGTTRVFRVGGAQAIGALAFGTETVPHVDKIVGPGNVYVTAAKRLVSNAVEIDKEAGPSEVIVIADSTADPRIVAADLVAQAARDPWAVAGLLTPDRELVRNVDVEIRRQLDGFPRDEARRALERNGALVVVSDIEQAVELSNRRAPEHLELIVKDPQALLEEIRHAGAVFLGPWSPVPAGDYMAGPNHVLPTDRQARAASPLRTEDFLKVTSVIEYSRDRLAAEAADIERLAEVEGLPGHARAVRMRLEEP